MGRRGMVDPPGLGPGDWRFKSSRPSDAVMDELLDSFNKFKLMNQVITKTMIDLTREVDIVVAGMKWDNICEEHIQNCEECAAMRSCSEYNELRKCRATAVALMTPT